MSSPIREKIGGEYGLMVLLAEQCSIAMESVVQRFKDHEGWSGRAGGYFSVADAKNGLPLLTILIGEVPLNKAPKYREFAEEKNGRLASHPDHQSSYESRNPDRNEWGGAIRVMDKLLSFSGLPELGDEALMLETARRASMVPFPVLDRIAQRNNNPYWTPAIPTR